MDVSTTSGLPTVVTCASPILVRLSKRQIVACWANPGTARMMIAVARNFMCTPAYVSARLKKALSEKEIYHTRLVLKFGATRAPRDHRSSKYRSVCPPAQCAGSHADSPSDRNGAFPALRHCRRATGM